MRDDELKALYRRAVAARAAGDRSGCVSPDDLLALVERRDPESERLRVLDHVMQCPACGPELELLRALRAARPEQAAVRPRWMRSVLPLAASVVLAVGGVAIWRTMSGPSPDIFRGVDGPRPTLIAPAGAVPETDARALVWRPVAEAVRYEVEVTSAGGALVHRDVVRDTAFLLPGSIVLEPDADYLWWVEAVLADGSRRTAEPVTFTVTR